MAERFVFDAPGVEALEAGDREWRAWDKALPGFGVRIRPSGTKSWIVRARTRGADGKVRRQRITIGRCGEMGLEEARTEARRLLGAGAGAAAAEAPPAPGMDDRASRGRGDGIGDPAPGPDGGGHGAAGSLAADDRVVRKTAADGAAAGGDRPVADTVADLTKRLDSVRGDLARNVELMAKIGPQLDELADAMPVIARDRKRGRRRRAGAVLGAVLVGVAALASGVYVQSREPLLPQADPTLGWKDHVWEHYGEAVMVCFQRAKKTESGYADCTLKVRGR